MRMVPSGAEDMGMMLWDAGSAYTAAPTASSGVHSLRYVQQDSNGAAAV